MSNAEASHGARLYLLPKTTTRMIRQSHLKCGLCCWIKSFLLQSTATQGLTASSPSPSPHPASWPRFEQQWQIMETLSEIKMANLSTRRDSDGHRLRMLQPWTPIHHSAARRALVPEMAVLLRSPIECHPPTLESSTFIAHWKLARIVRPRAPVHPRCKTLSMHRRLCHTAPVPVLLSMYTQHPLLARPRPSSG